MGYWKKVQVELDEIGDSTDGIDIEKEMREAMMEDKLHCDGCKKDGSFNEDDSPLLYSQDWDNKIYCNDCIPKSWNEKEMRESIINEYYIKGVSYSQVEARSEAEAIQKYKENILDYICDNWEVEVIESEVE